MAKKDTNKILEEMLLLNKNMDVFYKELRDSTSKVEKMSKKSDEFAKKTSEESKKNQDLGEEKQKSMFQEFADSVSKNLEKQSQKSSGDVSKFFQNTISEFSNAVRSANKDSKSTAAPSNNTLENLFSDNPSKIIRGNTSPDIPKELVQKAEPKNLSNVVTTNSKLETGITPPPGRTDEILENIQSSFEQRDREQRELEEALLGLSGNKNEKNISRSGGSVDSAIVEASPKLETKTQIPTEPKTKNLEEVLDLNSPAKAAKETTPTENPQNSPLNNLNGIVSEEKDPLLKQISDSVSSLTQDQNLASQFLEYVKQLESSEREGLAEEPAYLKDELDRFRLSNGKPDNFSLESLQGLANPIPKPTTPETSKDSAFVGESKDFLESKTPISDTQEPKPGGESVSRVEKIIDRISESVPNMKESIEGFKDKGKEAISRVLDRVELKKETASLGSINPFKKEPKSSDSDQSGSNKSSTPITTSSSPVSASPAEMKSTSATAGKKSKENPTQIQSEGVSYDNDLKQIKSLLANIYNVLNGPMSATKENPYRPYSNQF